MPLLRSIPRSGYVGLVLDPCLCALNPDPRVLVVVSQGSAREKGADAAGSGEAVAADAAAVRHCARRCACESTIIIIMQCSLMIDLTPVWLVRLCSDLL